MSDIEQGGVIIKDHQQEDDQQPPKGGQSSSSNAQLLGGTIPNQNLNKKIDFSSAIDLDRDITTLDRMTRAITEPETYLKEKKNEMLKIRDRVNRRAMERYKDYIRLGYSVKDAKKKATIYAQEQLDSERSVLNQTYPSNLNELAQGKTYHKSINVMRGGI